MTEDVRVSFDWRNETAAQLRTKIAPIINARWIGLGILSIDWAMRMLVWPYATPTKNEA